MGCLSQISIVVRPVRNGVLTEPRHLGPHDLALDIAIRDATPAHRLARERADAIRLTTMTDLPTERIITMAAAAISVPRTAAALGADLRTGRLHAVELTERTLAAINSHGDKAIFIEVFAARARPRRRVSRPAGP